MAKVLDEIGTFLTIFCFVLLDIVHFVIIFDYTHVADIHTAS